MGSKERAIGYFRVSMRNAYVLRDAGRSEVPIAENELGYALLSMQARALEVKWHFQRGMQVGRSVYGPNWGREILFRANLINAAGLDGDFETVRELQNDGYLERASERIVPVYREFYTKYLILYCLNRGMKDAARKVLREYREWLENDWPEFKNNGNALGDLEGQIGLESGQF